MYHKIFSQLVAVVLIGGMTSLAYGQATRSPFTSLGIGDIIDPALAHNQGNGGLGLSNGNYWNLNNVNPALLPYNSLTVFTAGFIGANRKLKNSTVTEKNKGGNLNYLITSFPVKPGIWTTSVGLTPYSNVDYKFSFSQTVTGSSDTVNITEQGAGGLSQFYWSNGVAINKYVSVGLKASYIFGSIEKQFSNTIQNVGNVYTPIVTDRIIASDFAFGTGVTFNVDSIFSSRIKFKAGLTYDLESNIKTKHFQSFNRAFNNNALDSDTLTYKGGSITIPQAIGVGISFNRGLKWMVGMDVKMQQWADFKDIDGSNTDLDNSFKVILGGEYTPDPQSVTSYLKRVTYRLGGSYENTPYLVNNNGAMEQVKDVGINFGWSLPVGRFSSFDMAFKFGKRGDIAKTNVQENYYKVYLGITFNDQWFIKRKYD
ncbi:MAG TPA: outer membrane protein transport protein [Fulvivirga sp.]|nr:outer membrane protein transport protein [Fulvivirga sp.]